MKNVLLLLTLCLAACGGMDNFKHPTFSNPQSMSADTLCYRYATAQKDANLDAEVHARGLDCDAILAEDPLYQ